MRPIRVTAVSLSSIAAVLSFGPAPAGAAPTRLSGALQLGPPTVLSEQANGPVTIDEQQGTAWLFGDIASGPAGGSLSVVEMVGPDGRAEDRGTWTGTATIDGVTGQLTLRLAGSDDGATSSGHLVATGAGALADVHGSGDYAISDTTGGGTYTLRIGGGA